MLEETNLESIKQVAKNLIKIPLATTEYSPMIVSYPFTNSGIVMIKTKNGYELKDITKDKEALKSFQKELADRVDEIDCVKNLFYLVDASYRLFVFHLISKFLSLQDFSSLLGSIWVNSEYANMDLNVPKKERLKLFKMADKSFLMTEKEQEKFNCLDETVVIYRGITSFNNVKSMSWTTNFEQAKWFANRFGSDGKVYSAKIKKDKILAYFDRANEDEVVVDYNFLKNIEMALESPNSEKSL